MFQGKSIRKIGRTYEKEGILWCGLSGTGITFCIKAKTCRVTFVADQKYISEAEQARIAIYVNGRRTHDWMLCEPKMTVSVLDLQEEGIFTIEIRKLSEAPMSLMGIQEVWTDGTYLEGPEQGLRIEFIGDSITCGYGVDAGLEVGFSTHTEDVTKSYAYLTAKELGAAYSMVSYSGYGIISGYTEGDKVKDQLIPDYYGLVAKSQGVLPDGTVFSKLPWDEREFVADLVVINLGTNDASYCREIPSREKEYTRKYVKFLRQVRSRNQKAYLLATIGIMGQSLFPALESAVAIYKKQTGDERIGTFLFSEQKEENGYASDYHPSVMTHRIAARELTKRIREGIQKKEIAIRKELYEDTMRSRKVIAISFDDGPSADCTPRLLSLLKQYDAVATFFALGSHMQPALQPVVMQACRQGCHLENHTMNHAVLTELTKEEIRIDIEDCSKKIAEYTGRKPQFFRPPYLAYDETVVEIANLPLIGGFGVDDWDEAVSVTKRIEDFIKLACDGAIVLLHDMEGNVKTVEAMEEILAYLTREGYQTVTIEELFAIRGVTPVVSKELYTKILMNN